MAIIEDSNTQIQNEIKRLKSSGLQEEIIEGGITIASEILFLDADQVVLILSTLFRLLSAINSGRYTYFLILLLFQSNRKNFLRSIE